MTTKTFEASSVDEALSQAAQELGVSATPSASRSSVTGVAPPSLALVIIETV